MTAGVSRLAGALAEVCVPEVKLEQVEAQLDAQARILYRRLAPFYVSSDVETRLEEKRAAADRLVDALYASFDLSRWGELMEALVVDPGRIADEIARIPDDIHIVAGAEAARVAVTGSGDNRGPRARPGRPRPGGGRAAEVRPRPDSSALAEDPALRMRRLTVEAFQAERALTVWIETLRALLERPERLARYGLTDASASDLVGELIEASRRLELDARIRAALEEWNFSLSAERRAAPAATVAAEIINRFVARLGMDALPESKRPMVEFEGGSRRVFAERPLRDAFRSLPDRPHLGAEDRLVDWSFALHRTFEDNARNVEGGEVDLEQNLRLGEILRGLGEDADTRLR